MRTEGMLLRRAEASERALGARRSVREGEDERARDSDVRVLRETRVADGDDSRDGARLDPGQLDRGNGAAAARAGAELRAGVLRRGRLLIVTGHGRVCGVAAVTRVSPACMRRCRSIVDRARVQRSRLRREHDEPEREQRTEEAVNRGAGHGPEKIEPGVYVIDSRYAVNVTRGTYGTLSGILRGSFSAFRGARELLAASGIQGSRTTRTCQSTSTTPNRR